MRRRTHRIGDGGEAELMNGKGPALLLVMMDIDPEYEAEFNRWYEDEHVPERMSIPGFLNARRYRAIEGEPKYLALYELESPDVLESESYRYWYGEGRTEWTKRILAKSSHFLRNVYVEILPQRDA